MVTLFTVLVAQPRRRSSSRFNLLQKIVRGRRRRAPGIPPDLPLKKARFRGWRFTGGCPRAGWRGLAYGTLMWTLRVECTRKLHSACNEASSRARGWKNSKAVFLACVLKQQFTDHSAFALYLGCCSLERVLGGDVLGDREAAALLHDLGLIDRPEEVVDVLLDLLWYLEAGHLRARRGARWCFFFTGMRPLPAPSSPRQPAPRQACRCHV